MAPHEASNWVLKEMKILLNVLFKRTSLYIFWNEVCALVTINNAWISEADKECLDEILYCVFSMHRDMYYLDL